MAHTILVHVSNEDAVVGEVEELPEPNAQFLMMNSPRLRDGREVPYLLPETHTVIYPWHRIHSVEVLPSEGEEEIVTFVRE
jgi:hypothetical protein